MSDLWGSIKDYWGVGSQSLSDEERRRKILADAELPDNWGEQHPEALNMMMKGQAGISLDQRQKLFKIAAEGGAAHGGAAVSHGGRGMPYGDTAMFNPKTMPPRYISGTRPREEDEPPGLATFSPYRMYS